MTHASRAVTWAFIVIFSAVAMVGLMRWAKKGGRGVSMAGSAMVLMLGMGLVVPEQLPQQRIEELQEDKGKKGAESGDPPTDPDSLTPDS